MAANKRDVDKDIREVPISNLRLDTRNPRFAGELGGNPSQEQMVNFIADVIGISDLLSSMSRAGYHRAHPLIGVQENGEITIVEGNRRLAAALILLSDERASKQRQRARSYPLSDSVRPRLTNLPVIVAASRREVLPYLGIAHIVGNKKWDSYAKAAWAADVLDTDLYEGGLKEIADEIGDTHGTLERLLEAFRLVKQLESKGLFSPDDTIKKGRGTAKFPFSWIYTALGYTSVREWLDVNEPEHEKHNVPAEFVPVDSLDKAAELLQWMFGSRSKPQEPLIDESRQIADLAASVGDEERLVLLRRGYNIAHVQREVLPAYQKVADNLSTAEDALKAVLGVLGSSGREIPESQLHYLSVASRRVADAAVAAYRQMRALAEPDLDEQLSMKS